MDALIVRCYRGVAMTNPQYQDALHGIAKPRGGPATPAEHNDGDTQSEFTSWTTDWHVALEKAMDRDMGGAGVILQKDFDAIIIVLSPDAYFESEVLVRGLVIDALVIEVS